MHATRLHVLVNEYKVRMYVIKYLTFVHDEIIQVDSSLSKNQALIS